MPKREKSEGEKEQDQRIKGNLKDLDIWNRPVSFNEFDAAFEDRDPFEFL